MLPTEISAFANTNLCNDCGNVSRKGKQASRGEEDTMVEDFKCSVRALICFSVGENCGPIFISNKSDDFINIFLSISICNN